jgi:DNA replication protein DnaC
MNTNQTLEHLQELKLKGMSSVYQTQLNLPVHQQLDAHEMIAQLAQAEVLSRQTERTGYYLKLARLRITAYPEHVYCSSSRNLSKQQLSLLLQGTYIKQGEPILITGPTGCGKSYLACALAYQACLMGYKTQYFNMNRFIEQITQAKLEGSYLKTINFLEKIPLIILDDFGMQTMSQQIKLALLQIVEDRYERKSIIITSQLPVAKWHEFINEPTMADAILDRLTAKSHRIELKGESLRNKNNLMKNQE